MSEKKVVFDCEVTEKVFTNKETGEQVPYLDCRLIVGDNSIKVNVKQEDKSLFKHLVKDYFN